MSADAAPRPGLWPRIPREVLGRPLPGRFRRGAIRFADADAVLVDFVAWLDAGGGPEDRVAGERAALVRASLALRPRLPGRALPEMVTDALRAAGADDGSATEATAAGPAPEPQAPRRRGLWPALPTAVLGEPVPGRFRRTSLRFADADRVLVAFIGWLEAAGVRPRAADGAAAERDVLVRLWIDLRERLGESALDPELREVLRGVGVVEVDARGERFDPARHRAAGTTPTSDPEQHDVVAETERLGYTDHGRLLVLPEVIVFRAEGR